MTGILMICFMMPVSVEKKDEPPQQVYFVKVDRIVINRHRHYRVKFDAWDRPQISCYEYWWVSFWDKKWIPIPFMSVFIWQDRGYFGECNIRSISQCTDGWMIESVDGVNVISENLIFVDSPYDWEMRKRVLYNPITPNMP